MVKFSPPRVRRAVLGWPGLGWADGLGARVCLIVPGRFHIRTFYSIEIGGNRLTALISHDRPRSCTKPQGAARSVASGPSRFGRTFHSLRINRWR